MATHVIISSGSYSEADVPAPLETDEGEGEVVEVVEEKPV